MISICIPIYNFDVRNLLEELIRQINLSAYRVEIILIDDASGQSYKERNSSIPESIRYIQLEKNIGRSRIRNLFLDYAKYDYLLFLDCDSMVISDHFIANYIEIILEESPEIVCGGRVYSHVKPEKDRLLRWKYGHGRESLSAQKRNENPNNSFMSNNFLIQKKILLKHRFEESLSEYGHEDTLFGFQLKKNKIDIRHIENPVLNGDLETNEEYLIKTEKSIKNLKKILNLINHDPEFIEDVSLLRWHKILVKYKLSQVFSSVFKLSGSSLRYALISGKGSLALFSFYKLGYLLSSDKTAQ